ncbi:glycine betaine ABC transporter substrate-binding protein [Microbispora hainanensis]|uniref:glycine betaine ABC transporter substrate-binding protein n=1 Tax=Microbispora hainanensis TaxID=568844 RepID=UPI00142E9F10|nr:glycine betaine ABC transporter substrate-binding protein [Microbispora hainanensis]
MTVVLVAATALAACSGTTTDGFATTSGGSGARVARFVQQPWSDLVVETQIAIDILGKLGYQASTQEVSVPLAGQALATGKADAYLGNWWPSQQQVFQKPIDEGKVKVVGTLLSGTQYAPAVPGWVADKYGVHSLADLDKNGDLFGRKIYGIEPGAPANQIIQEAIDKDAYGLGDWQLVQSSTEAMLAEVTRRTAKHQPIVFLGWSPHWMTIDFKLVFMDDPQKVWPGAGEIRVLERMGLDKQDPNLHRFLSQMKVDADSASAWIRALDKEKKTAKAAAEKWMKTHPDMVAGWLNGVTDINGKPASDVVLPSLKG